ncbi:MAG: phosphate signaling complex protein PhoU [Deinococcus sp.]
MREALEHDLNAVLNGALRMLSIIEEMLPLAGEALKAPTPAGVERVRALDLEVDGLEAKVEAECLRLIALHQPVARDLRLIALVLKSLTDIERMGDYAVHVAEDGEELGSEPATGSQLNLTRMLERLQEMSAALRGAVAGRDVQAAQAALKMDDEVDDLYEQVQRDLVNTMLAEPRHISRSLVLLRVGRSLERIGDHMENVAERVQYWVTGQR